MSRGRAPPPLRPAARRPGPRRGLGDDARAGRRARRPGTSSRRQLDELVAGPLQLLPILAEDNLLATTATPGPLLEVLTRRYYKIRELGDVTIGDDDVVRADYVHRGRRIHVLAARARPGALDEVAGDGRRGPPAAIEAPDTAVVDLYLPLPGGQPLGRRGALGGAGRRAPTPPTCPPPVRRVALIVSHPDAGTEVLTFRRPDDDGVRPYWMAPGLPSRRRATRPASRRTSSSAACTR